MIRFPLSNMAAEADTTFTSIVRMRRAILGKATSLTLGRVYLAVGDLEIGVFAEKLIRAGEIITEFRGPIIDFDQAVAKGSEECYTLQVGPSRYMDLEQPGCFVNHSCDPNAGIKGLSLVAIRDIQERTEIRYDYSTTMDEDWWTMSCACGSKRCRRLIRDFRCLNDDVRIRYLRQGIVPNFIAARYPHPEFKEQMALVQ